MIIVTAIKAYGVSKSAIISGIACGLCSFATIELSAPVKTGIAIAASAACSALGAGIVAFFRHRPATIQAVSAAKIAESELVGRQAAAMIARLESKLEIAVETIRLHVEIRHDIEGLLSPLQHAFDLVCIKAETAGVQLPTDLPNIAEQIRVRKRQLDDELRKIPKPRPLVTEP